ncbi:hypothetical protein Pelo_18023 [Pelomyxa schiedti]|nr:hypothetical protein Pelo_18023 [Pelomyxa schiedti]
MAAATTTTSMATPTASSSPTSAARRSGGGDRGGGTVVITIGDDGAQAACHLISHKTSPNFNKHTRGDRILEKVVTIRGAAPHQYVMFPKYSCVAWKPVPRPHHDSLRVPAVGDYLCRGSPENFDSTGAAGMRLLYEYGKIMRQCLICCQQYNDSSEYIIEAIEAMEKNLTDHIKENNENMYVFVKNEQQYATLLVNYEKTFTAYCNSLQRANKEDTGNNYVFAMDFFVRTFPRRSGAINHHAPLRCNVILESFANCKQIYDQWYDFEILQTTPEKPVQSFSENLPKVYKEACSAVELANTAKNRWDILIAHFRQINSLYSHALASGECAGGCSYNRLLDHQNKTLAHMKKHQDNFDLPSTSPQPQSLPPQVAPLSPESMGPTPVMSTPAPPPLLPPAPIPPLPILPSHPSISIPWVDLLQDTTSRFESCLTFLHQNETQQQPASSEPTILGSFPVTEPPPCMMTSITVQKYLTIPPLGLSLTPSAQYLLRH